MATAEIRRMAAEEVDVVSQLLVEANEEHFAAFPPEVARAYRREVADVAGRLPLVEVYVAELGGRLVGTVTYLADAGHDDHPWPPGGAVLRLLAVAPAARGQGVGGRLITACIGRARSAGARFVALHTAPNMASARRIYEGLGFVRTPEHDFDPGSHYGGAATADEHALWGLAYMLWPE